MSNFKRLFAIEKINSGRQFELDVARALAVIFMVFVHVQMTFSNENLINSSFGKIVDFMGGIPAAPIFMFLMGVGFLYTKKNNYKSFIKRGISIFLLGYLLNILRDSIPEMIDFFIDGKKESLAYAAEGLIDVDILQFAGLTMIFWGMIKKIKLKNLSIAIIGILLPILNIFLLNIKVTNLLWKAVTGLIWGSNEFSEFPFLTWIFYPLLGYFFAHFLIRCKNKKIFYKYLIRFSIPLILITSFIFIILLNQNLGLKTELDYYHHNFFTNIVYGLCCILWISLIYFSSRYIPKCFIKTVKRWSKNVTEIYFIHWIIIGWLGCIFYEYKIGIVGYIILSFCIFYISDKTASYSKKIRQLNSRKAPSKKY